MKIHVVGKFRPLCHTRWGLLVYKHQKLFLMNEQTMETVKLCDFPIIDKRKPMCFCDFGERFAHITAYCGIEVDGGAVVAFNRGIYFVDIVNKQVKREFDFVPKDMRRPLNFYKIKDVKGFEDMVICPDYSFNQERTDMSIWGRNKDGIWDKKYTFPAGTIRHIHSVINDPYRDRVLVFTGDLDAESAIWECKDGFRQVRQLTKASQFFRACCGQAFEEGVAIVTDSPFDQNYIYIIKEDGDDVHIEKTAEILGPTVFFNQYKEKLIFATDVEYDASSITGFRQYLTYKRGAGVKDWYVHIYFGSISEGFKEIARFKKDVFPMVTFGFGNVHFPCGEVDGKIFFSPLAVKKYDQRLCYFDMFEEMS